MRNLTVADGKADFGGGIRVNSGANGYDHKAMVITAKGAWESVKRRQ